MELMTETRDPRSTMSNDHPADPMRDAHPDGGRGPRLRPVSTALAVVLLAVVLAVGVGFAGVAVGHGQRAATPTITVTGSGTAQGQPDTVTFQVGVRTTAADASSALAQNNARMAALVAALERNGVAKKDMQTSGLNVYENTDSNGTLTGFSVENDLNVTMHDVRRAGSAIDAAARAAGNGITLYGVSFSISNQSRLLASARARAMRNARTQATQVAAGGNASLGSVVKVTDQENTSSPAYPFPSAQGTAFSAVKTPIESGTQSITVQVTVVYALNG
jgi:uncharacterized protein